jgi:hypothetical protein
VVEANYGALMSGVRRQSELARLIAGVRVVPVDAGTIERVGQLRNQCRVIGHTGRFRVRVRAAAPVAIGG